MFYSQKYYIFAPRFTKKGTKLQKIIHLNKQIYEKSISNRIVLRQIRNPQNFRIKFFD